MAHRGQTKSVVWKFFTVNEDDATNVTCKLCTKILSRGNKNEKKLFNTTNMNKHLRSQHLEQMEQEEAQQAEELAKAKTTQKRTMSNYITATKKTKAGSSCSPSTSTSSHSQITLEETLELKKSWGINSVQSKKIQVAIGEMIALDSQPFSIVEDIGFTRLMKLLKPNYELPSRKYFKNNIVPDLHSKVMAKINSRINEASNMSFTTDIWTNNADASFISLTANCIDENFNQSIVVLRVKPFPDSHTATNICDTVQDVVDDYKIPPYKVHMIVHDNAANMVKGITNIGYNSLSCFLHTIQLVIHDAIFEQRMIKDIISDCRKITGHFDHSSLAYTKLELLQTQHNLPKHKLIQDVVTRWNSTYLMLERIFEQKNAIANYCAEVPNLPVFDANIWALIGKCSHLLKIFHVATQRLSERTANASEIIPQVRVLKHAITKAASDSRFSGLGSTISAISRSLDSRFAKYEENQYLISATILDPQYKNSLFKRSEEGSITHAISVTNFLAETRKKIIKDQENYNENVSSASTGIEPDNGSEIVGDAGASADLFDFHSCLNDLIESETTGTNKETSSKKKVRRHSSSSSLKIKIEKELEKYCSMPLEPRDVDPLLWWKTSVPVFPELAKLANKLLSSPPSSVESERLFSIGGNIFSPHRNRLTPQTGEQLMLLNFNLRVFNLEY